MLKSLVAVAMAGGLAVIGTSLTSKNMQFTARLENNMELSIIKSMILDNYDCTRSVGAANGARCRANRDYPIRGANGTLLTDRRGRIGEWTVRARCVDRTIVFRATRRGRDPHTNRPYSTLPAATDLFEGTLPAHCEANFRPAPRSGDLVAYGQIEAATGSSSARVTIPDSRAVRYIRPVELKTIYKTEVGSSVWNYVRGLQCRSENGWYFLSCNAAGFRRGPDSDKKSDTLMIGNGCVTNDFDGVSAGGYTNEGAGFYLRCIRRDW